MSISTMTLWPALPYADWKDTLYAVHRWTQIIGKIRLANTPLLNHEWNSTLQVSPRGLTTGLVAADGGAFAIELDLATHELSVVTNSGRRAAFPLRAMSVAEFYGELMAALATVGVRLPRISRLPVEVAVAIPFDKDGTPRPYDHDAVRRFHEALLHTQVVFEHFRAGFFGKVSPVHFFWGGFDLAVTRFSGRRNPTYAGGVPPHVHPHVMHEAYSHQLASAGFWPGSDEVPRAEYYAYPMPAVEGLERVGIEPAGAGWDAARGEFLLPYELVRTSPQPEAMLMSFLESTYDAIAEFAKWDRASLETGVVCECDSMPAPLRRPPTRVSA